jgi:hypothetical protein
MRCPSCDGVIEESDVQFCPFCGMQIRASQASDPDRRAHATTDAPGSSRRSQLHPLLEILKKDRRYSWIVSEQPISPAANLSLIFAYLGIIQCVPLLFSILAIVVGYHALDEIAASNGRLGGRGRAIASIIMGCIQLAVLIGFIILVAVSSWLQKQPADLPSTQAVFLIALLA